MSYIKREPLLQIAKELQKNDAFGAPLIVREIENAPAEDVIEVVRCVNCEWVKQDNSNGCNNYICICPWLCERYVKPYGYCSDGKRRTDNDSKRT